MVKVVEIAPGFQLEPHLRDQLHADAVNLAKQVRLYFLGSDAKNDTRLKALSISMCGISLMSRLNRPFQYTRVNAPDERKKPSGSLLVYSLTVNNSYFRLKSC